MRLILFLLAGIGLAAPGYATVQLSVRASPVISLWSFAKTIADLDRHQSPQLLEIFSKSKYGSDPTWKAKLAELHHLHDLNFSQSFDYRGFPASRADMSWDIEKHFDYQASQSKDLSEFKSRTALLLPPAEHLRLFQILESLSPVYGELIWKPSEKKLDDYGKRLLAAWNKGQLSDLMNKVEIFYRAKWPDPLLVTVHLMPIPASTGHTRATVDDHAVLLEALLDEKDMAGRASVIFHELCHAASESETAEDQKQLAQWFEKSNSPYRIYAQSLMEEGLATALGNGLAYKTITGVEKTEPWYDVDEFDRGAKAESELTRSYVLASKPMDETFVSRWIEQYAKKFPEAPTDPGIRFRHTLLMVDDSVVPVADVRAILRKSTRISSLSSHPLSSNDRLMTNFEDSAMVIVGDKKSFQEIQTLAKALPVIKDLLPLIKKTVSSSVVGGFAKDRPVLLFKLEKNDDFKELLKKVLTEKALPMTPAVISQ